MSKPNESMMPESVGEELIFQYENLFHVLEVTIRRLSHKQWTTGPNLGLTPVRLACHILWACELYATGDDGGCERRFGCAAQALDGDIPLEKLPTVTQVLAYSGEVWMAVHRWLSQTRDAEWMERTPNWGWRERGLTRLGHVLYVLRHATLHLGQLCGEMERRGLGYGVFK